MSLLDNTRVALRPLLLPTLCLTLLLDALNLSGVNMVLPRIQKDLGFTTNDLQWVVSAYALTFGGFLMLTGRLGNIYGHKNLFIIGLLWFTVFAIMSGYSTSSIMMIISRSLQGIGAASTVPNAVALVVRHYEKGLPRNRAMTIFGSITALGFVLSLIICDVAKNIPLRWRSIFDFSAIISAIMAILSVLVIPKSSKLEEEEIDADADKNKKTTIDIWGALLSTTSVVLLAYVLTDGNTSGWSNPRIISLLIVAVVLLAVFIFVEFRIKQFLMPLWIWHLPSFVASFVIAVCLLSFFQGYIYYLTIICQNIFHLSPIQATICYLPLGIVAGIFCISSDKFVYRYNIKRYLIAGLTLGGIGNIIIGWYNADGQYLRFAFPSFIISLGGLSSVYVSMAIAALDSASPDVAGIIGGMLNTTFQIGEGLGLAIFVAACHTINPAGDVADVNDILKSYHAALLMALGIITVALVVAIFFKNNLYDPKKDIEKKDNEEKGEETVQRRMEEGTVTMAKIEESE